MAEPTNPTSRTGTPSTTGGTGVKEPSRHAVAAAPPPTDTADHPSGHHSGPRVEPARRLDPEPGRDRPWRVLLVVLASTTVVLMLASLGAWSLFAWNHQQSFSHVAATHGVGTPQSLSLSADVANVQVVRDAAAEEVSIALVPMGSTSLPAPGETARAEVSVAGTATDREVQVRQPRFNSLPWENPHRDLLVVIPEDHVLALDLDTDVGDVELHGEFSELVVTADVGDVELVDITAPDGIQVRAEVGQVALTTAAAVPGGITVTNSVGDATVQLAPDASGDLEVTSDIGDVEVRLPGSARWSVDAASETGATDVAPEIVGADGQIAGHLTVRSSVGDVDVTR